MTSRVILFCNFTGDSKQYVRRYMPKKFMEHEIICVFVKSQLDKPSLLSHLKQHMQVKKVSWSMFIFF